MLFIDTHTHLDGEEFAADRAEVVARARQAGVTKVFIPAIDLPSVRSVLDVCTTYRGFAYPMIGLHPEEVRSDWREVLTEMRQLLDANLQSGDQPHAIAVGEVGLDYYWSREYAQEQLDAFEQQVLWSIETRLPLMIHCRKAQQEMVRLLRRYKSELPGGVFHCFTGNEKEAAELLRFDRFLLGIGGVLTFKKSHLPEVIRDIPLSRIVLETDSPYMAPVPMRGKRNEPAFTAFVLEKMADAYGIAPEEVARQTTANALQLFLPE